VWSVVGLFAGIAAMLAVWLLMSSDPEAGKAPPGVVPIGRMPHVERRPLDLKDRRLPDVALQRLIARGAKEGAPGSPRAASTAPTPGVYPLDQDGVKGAVESRRTDLKACWDTARFHTPDLPAEMTLVLDVQPVEGESTSQVAKVATDGVADASVFEGCAATVFEGVRFATTDATTLRYPLDLEP
jgi:hypothetical protein